MANINIVNTTSNFFGATSGTLTIPATTPGNVLVAICVGYVEGLKWTAPNFLSTTDGNFTEVAFYSLQGGVLWDWGTVVGCGTSSDVLYQVTSGGVTSVNFNCSGLAGFLIVLELSGLITPVSVDDFKLIGSAVNGAIVGSALAGSGSNDLCIENFANSSTAPDGVNSPWTISDVLYINGAGPVYQQGVSGTQAAAQLSKSGSPISDNYVCTSVAFKGVGSPVPVTPSVKQITFNTGIFANGVFDINSPAGNNGYDAWTVYPDKDGTTFWAFEYAAQAFARVNLNDGSIIHQDNFIPVHGGLLQKLQAHDTTLWAQDSSTPSHYYVLDGTFLTKFHIAAGPAGNLMNGYCIVDATLDLSAVGPGLGSTPEDMVAMYSGGVNYVVIVDTSFNAMYIIDVDAMAVVGTYVNSSFGYFQTFLDKNGDVWFCGNNNSNGDSFVKWHPADGASGGNLNVTATTVPNATVGFTGSEWFTYIPANHAVFIAGGPGGSSYTSQTAVIDLTSFARLAYHADDLTFFFQGWNFNQYGGQSIGGAAMDIGVLANGLLCNPGTVNPQTSQAGGILNIIDPVTLTLTPNTNPLTVLVTYGDFGGSPVYIISGLVGSSSYNLTDIINSSQVATKIRTFGGLGVESVPPVMMAIVLDITPPVPPPNFPAPPGGTSFVPNPPLQAGPVQNIPLNNSPNQEWDVAVNVDGVPVTLVLTLRYNEIAKYWVATVRDSQGDLLVDSVPFVTGEGISQNILGQFAYLAIGSATIYNASQVA